MSIFRKTRISNEQLQAILASLPQAKASSDFEENLDKMIASNSHHVPNLLGSLPLVPAPDDFDARLMEAIRDRRRPVAPIPIAVAAGGASINWINHIMGWIGGSLAVVTLAFVINNATETPDAAKAPAAAPRHTAGASTTSPVATPPAAPVGTTSAQSASSVARGTVAQAEPQSAITGPSNARREDVAPAASHHGLAAPPSTLHEIEAHAPVPSAIAVPDASVQHDNRNTAADPAVVNGTIDVATGPNKTDTTATSSDKEEAAPQVPEGTVNTGADPGVDTINRPR
jgi:hypothetical protein